MITKRIIACLDVHDGRVVKGVQFVDLIDAGDPATQAALSHHGRDLEALGDHLLTLHRKAIAASGMTGRALPGDLPFH